MFCPHHHNSTPYHITSWTVTTLIFQQLPKFNPFFTIYDLTLWCAFFAFARVLFWWSFNVSILSSHILNHLIVSLWYWTSTFPTIILAFIVGSLLLLLHVKIIAAVVCRSQGQVVYFAKSVIVWCISLVIVSIPTHLYLPPLMPHHPQKISPHFDWFLFSSTLPNNPGKVSHQMNWWSLRPLWISHVCIHTNILSSVHRHNPYSVFHDTIHPSYDVGFESHFLQSFCQISLRLMGKSTFDILYQHCRGSPHSQCCFYSVHQPSDHIHC